MVVLRECPSFFSQAANIIVSKGYAATAKSLWIFPAPGILVELQAKSRQASFVGRKEERRRILF